MISFSEFLSALNPDQEPYPWQVRFAEASAEDSPPQLVSVPTGAGKTTVLEALIWALASQAERPAHERTVGCRVVWAIDRRILVDEVHERATTLANRLDRALDDAADPLNGVATRLRAMAGGGCQPLVVTRWRGGIADDEPLLSPTQPQIITSTIAQVGSRLLFRGYGVGARSLSLQAGLAGCDTTICLDEAHLAQPFVETIAEIRRVRAEHNTAVALPPLGAVTLTATPANGSVDAIELSAEDRQKLGKRLSATKTAQLDDSATKDRERATRLAELVAESVAEGAMKVACVVNTVRQAIAVHEMLTKRDKKNEWEPVLLIGPQRPVDREKVLKSAGPVLFSGKQPDRPLICVATQTFEVGLDADVEVLVTESASASALVQRLGRLNRRGKGVGRAVVVRDPDSWLYGADEALAWEWLEGLRKPDGTIDVSVAALEADATRPLPLKAPTAPGLTDQIIDLLVQPPAMLGPYCNPDIDPLLRGSDENPADDVTVCWRADLRMDEADHDYRRDLLELAPPQPSEKLTISLAGARALLAALHPASTTNRKNAMKTASDDADIEGDAPEVKLPPLAEDEPASFLVIHRRKVKRGALRSGEAGTISLNELSPGDTLVLPSALGEDVADLGVLGVTEKSTVDAAPDVREQMATPEYVRISPEALDVSASETAEEGLRQSKWRRASAECRKAEGSPPETVAALVEELANAFPRHTGLADLLARQAEGTVLRIDMVSSPAFEADEPPLDEPATDDTADEEIPTEGAGDGPAERRGPTWVIRAIADTRKDKAPRPGAEIPTINSHAEAVRTRVSEYCERLQLEANLGNALELAAAAHDHGKADRRIQDFYWGGTSSIGEQQIAKSTFGTGSRRLSERAAERAGLPVGLRHEVASAAVLRDAVLSNPDLCPTGVDMLLVEFLVLGHHGFNRPFPTLPRGGDPPSGVYCDAAGISGAAKGDGLEDWCTGEPMERFWQALDHYGAWGASYLLAVLMLADRSVSSEGH